MTANTKEQALKMELTAQESDIAPYVSIERFFEGNTDEGSIGCNLLEHPGIGVFRDTLVGLLRRPDVEAVYAQISEIDPGTGLWPFTDMVVVVGSIAAEELARLVAPLEPDEVADAQEGSVSEGILSAHKSPVLYAWWD